MDSQKQLPIVNLPEEPSAEACVIGACLLEGTAFSRISGVVTADMFSEAKYQHVWRAMAELNDELVPIDKLTVMDQLRKNGNLAAAGGPYVIAKSTSVIASSANLEYHAYILAQQWIGRETTRMCSAVVSYQDRYDPIHLLMGMHAKINDLLPVATRNSQMNLADQLNSAVDVVQRIASGKEAGIPIDLYSLQRITNGLFAGELTVVGARPGHGKTAFALSLAVGLLKRGISVYFASAEMASEAILMRVLANVGSIRMGSIRGQAMADSDWQALDAARATIFSWPLLLDDAAPMDITRLCQRVRAHKRKHGLQVLIVDYLQLIAEPSNDRRVAVGNVSRKLKILAKELKLPIVALAQVSRDVRGNNIRPEPHHLKESGDIEQDADNIWMLYRPDLHGLHEFEDGTSTEGVVCLSVAKQRNGEVTSKQDLRMRWEPEYQRISEMASLRQNMPEFYYESKPLNSPF